MRFRLTPRIALPALLGAALACGGGGNEPPPGEPAPPVADTTPSLAPATAPEGGEVTLLRAVPDGGPMPEADRVGGVPPYPGAVVHTRHPHDRPDVRSFEAFTADSWAMVEEYYDASLGPKWTKTDAKDTTIYQKADDEAAITVTPWDPEDLPPGLDHPPVLRTARTIIGVAWRVAPPPSRGGD